MTILPKGLLGGLLAAFLFACPALATDYYYDATDGDDANDCSSAGQACQTIGDLNGQDLNAGDNVFLQCGETWTDARLNLTTADDGASENPVAFSTYGTCGANPIIDGGGKSGAAILNGVDWVTFTDIDFDGTDGSGTNTNIIHITDATNITFTGGSVTGPMDTDANNTDAIRIINSSSDITFDTMTFDGVSGVGIAGGAIEVNCACDNIVIQDSTFLGLFGATVVHHSDNYGGTSGGSITITGSTFECSTGVCGSQQLDVKTGTVVVSDTVYDMTDNGGAALQLHNGDENHDPATITFNDVTFLSARAGFDDAVTVVFNRCLWYDDGQSGGSQFWRMTGSSASGDNTDVTINASTLEMTANSTLNRLVHVVRGDLEINNATLIQADNTANGGLELMELDSNGSGVVTIRNSILVSDGMVIIDEETSTNDITLTLAHNLYERSDQTTSWFFFDDVGSLDESDIGSTAPVDDSDSTSGDPDFESQDEMSQVYLKPNAGSPAIGLGDPAFLYDGAGSLDLSGVAYDTSTPAAGAREFAQVEGEFPLTAAPTETSIASFGTSNSINLPPTIAAGDGLIMLISADYPDAASSFDTPSGWSPVYTASGSNPVVGGFAKIATGSEGSTQTVTVTGASIQGVSAQVYRIRNWFGSLSGIAAASLVQTQTNSPDPPSLTAPWGSLTTLWIVVVHAADDDETVSSYSTGFIGGTDTISGAGTNAGSSIGSARQENSSETVDPGVFVISGSEATRSTVLAIRPAAAGETVAPKAIMILRQHSRAPANDNRPPLAMAANQ